MAKKQAEDNGTGKKVSRIVIDFAEPGSAGLTGFQLINVTPGQMLLFSKWAEFQGAIAFQQMMAQPKPQPSIIVPKMGGIVQ